MYVYSILPTNFDMEVARRGGCATKEAIGRTEELSRESEQVPKATDLLPYKGAHQSNQEDSEVTEKPGEAGKYH